MGSSRLQRVGRVEDLVARALTRCCQHHRLRPFGPLAADRRPPTHGRARVGATWAGRRASGSVHNLRETVLGPGMLCTTRVRSMPCTEALHDVMGRATGPETSSRAAAGGDHAKTVGCGREAPHVGARLGKGWWLLAATSTPPCAATSGEGGRTVPGQARMACGRSSETSDGGLSLHVSGAISQCAAGARPGGC